MSGTGATGNTQPKDRHPLPIEKMVPSPGRDFDVDEEFVDKQEKQEYQKGSNNDAQMSNSSKTRGKEYAKKENTQRQ